MSHKQGFWGMALLLFLVSAVTLVGVDVERDRVVRERLAEGQELAKELCIANIERGSPRYGQTLKAALGERGKRFSSSVLEDWQLLERGLYKDCLFYSSENGSDLFLFIKDHGDGEFSVFARAHDKMKPHKSGQCNLHRKTNSDCVRILPSIHFTLDRKKIRKRKLDSIVLGSTPIR